MIEYVTKNEETDELELKPISYGIPEHVDRDVLRFPDWSKSTTNITVSNNGTWTAPEDCWISINQSTNNTTGNKDVYINGVLVRRLNLGGAVWYDIFFSGPVRKGDVIRLTGGSGTLAWAPF